MSRTIADWCEGSKTVVGVKLFKQIDKEKAQLKRVSARKKRAEQRMKDDIHKAAYCSKRGFIRANIKTLEQLVD